MQKDFCGACGELREVNFTRICASCDKDHRARAMKQRSILRKEVERVRSEKLEAVVR